MIHIKLVVTFVAWCMIRTSETGYCRVAFCRFDDATLQRKKNFVKKNILAYFFLKYFVFIKINMPVRARAYVRVYVRLCACACTRVCVYVCGHVCVGVWACVHVCMCVHTPERVANGLECQLVEY